MLYSKENKKLKRSIKDRFYQKIKRQKNLQSKMNS